jgi:hypothetical protein
MRETDLWRQLKIAKAQIYGWLLPRTRYDGMLPDAYDEDDIASDLHLQPRTVSLVLYWMHEDGTISPYSRTSPLGYKHGSERGHQLAGADRRPSVREEWQRSDLRKQLRVEIAAGLHACATCKSEEDLAIDHRVPIARGGTNQPKNLQILCRSCNSRKGTKVATTHV